MLINRLQLLSLSLLIMVSFHSNAQDKADKTAKQTALKNSINARKFHFDAQSARTASGKTIQLTGGYHVKLNGDSLDVDLPYYGRSYSATPGNTDLAIRFKSTDFTYTADTSKKGGWDITIVPKNESKASKIYLSFSSSGFGYINILSNSRQQISFNGVIEALKQD